MILAASEAFAKTLGLAATFLGIQVIVTIIIIYIAVQIRGERAGTREYICLPQSAPRVLSNRWGTAPVAPSPRRQPYP